MSVDPLAGVSGLVGRAAAAFVSGVPEQPADDGFFGPGSVTWRLAGDISSPVGGLRALLLQALHPLAMAGVDQHSNWRQDPVGRLAATSAYVATVNFGERSAAEQAAAHVRRIHEHVTGTDPATGRPYAAGDPALLLWVHAALVDSTLAACRLFGTQLTPADQDRYVAEMTVAARLAGVPAGMAPVTVTGLEEYFAAVRPQLWCTPAAADAIGHLLGLPELTEDLGEIWQDIRDGVVGSLPEWAQDAYDYRPARPLTPERRTEIRQALGVLDAVFLGEPGVLEARQRIALRVRAARRS